MDPLGATTPSAPEAAPPSLVCAGCKATVGQDPNTLAGLEKASITTLACPNCNRLPTTDASAIGCHHCGRRLFVSAALAGHTARCPSCAQAVPVPAASDRPGLEASGKALKWLVFRGDTLLLEFKGRGDLVAAMYARTVRPDDICMVHRAAEPKSLRAACDTEEGLRSLYDPTGARAAQVGTAVFGVCAALYLIVDFYNFGWAQSIIFVTAILCVTVLRQFFWVGLIVLFVLGKLLGVPVGGGTFLSLVVEALSTALVGAIGGGIAYGATHLMGRVGRWNERAPVWRGVEASSLARISRDPA